MHKPPSKFSRACRRLLFTRKRRSTNSRYRRPGWEQLEWRLPLAAWYNFDVIAQTGSSVAGLPLTGLRNAPSINDSGMVAFAGDFAAGGGETGYAVVAGSSQAELQNLSGPVAANTSYSLVQINNAGKVLAPQKQTDPLFNRLPLFDAANPCGSCFQQLAGSGVLGTSIFAASSLSNTGQVVFGAIASPGENPSVRRPDGSGSGLGYFAAVYDKPGTTMRPLIADTGDFVYRAGNSEQDAIRLVNTFGNSSVIASAAYFRELGAAPGISDDGRIMAFYGDLTELGAAALTAFQPAPFFPLNPGPGIFLALVSNGATILQRIAGITGNGQLDPGERTDWRTGRDLGPDHNLDVKGKADFEIRRFDADSRVAVSLEPNSSQRGTISYVGFDERGKKSIFTSRFKLFPDSRGLVEAVGVEMPRLVIRANQEIGGLGTIEELSVYDPLNSQGQVSFLAESGGRQAVVRATPHFQTLYADIYDPDSPLVQMVVAGFPSPSGRAGVVPNQIVVHATAGSESGSIGTLTSNSTTSIHYVVSRDGRVTQVIPEAEKANHATSNLTNQHSIGIELVDDCRGITDAQGVVIDCRPNTGYKHDPHWATDPLLRSAALLVRDIARRRPEIKLEHIPRSPVAPTESGIIGHDQVPNSGKKDPGVYFPWSSFVPLAAPGVGAGLHSPANLLITDSSGRRSGIDPTSGEILLEIPGTQFSGPGTEPQTLFIPRPLSGTFQIQVNGIGTGEYHVDLFAGDATAQLSQTFVGGMTSPGQSNSYLLHYSAENSAQTSVAGYPRISVSDVTRREGDFGLSAYEFVVSLSAASNQPVTLEYATADDSATSQDADYHPATGTLTFEPGGPLQQTIRVMVNGDPQEEEHESFLLHLTNIVGATLGKTLGVGTIQNDDTSITVGSVRLPEGNAGPTDFRFEVSLSFPSILPVMVDFTTLDGSAVNPADYRRQRGTLTFEPGETTLAVVVPVQGDLSAEPLETFTLELSNPVGAHLDPAAAIGMGAILDDDTGDYYYINDGSPVGDVYTTAIGNNAHDGRSPSRPMASLTALFTKYPALQPGDTIFVDSGYYTVLKNILLPPALSGIRIIGPEWGELVQAATGNEVLASQPVAYWRLGSELNGVVLDQSGNEIHLNLTEHASVGSPGISDDGALTALGGGLVATALRSPLLTPLSALSLEMWLNTERLESGGSLDVLGLGNVLDGGYGFYVLAGKLRFWVTYGGFGGYYVEAPIPQGNWAHVVGTYDGSHVRLYLNGKLVGAVPYSGEIYYTDPDYQFQISRSVDTGLRGGIDELAVYDRALTPSEIDAHFAAVGFRRATLDRRNPNSGASVFELGGADDVTIANLAITGAGSGVAASAGASSTGLILLNNDIYAHTAEGVNLQATNDGLRLVDNRVYGNYGPGVTYTADGGLLLGNVISHNGFGFYSDIPVRNLSIVNNEFRENGTPTITAAGVAIRIAGNVIVGDGLFGTNSLAGVQVYAEPAAVGSDAVVVEDNDVSVYTVAIMGDGWRGRLEGGAEIVIRRNVVHDNFTGIELRRANALENTVFANETGIAAYKLAIPGALVWAPSEIIGNYVYANRREGILAYGAGNVSHNVSHSNQFGIVARTLPDVDSIAGNVVHGNREAGIVIAESDGVRVVNNTVVSTAGDAVQVTINAANIDLRNNILIADAGFGIYVADNSQVGLASNFNNIHVGPAGSIGYFGTTFDTLVDWSLELNLDRQSVSVPPMFINRAGRDGVSGYDPATGYDGGRDDDFHLRSDSPLLDLGDPAADYSREPAPNGGRIDLGAYGNTTEATTRVGVVAIRLPDNGLQLQEGWSRSAFEIVLTRPPSAEVEVRLAADGQVGIDANLHTFGANNWNVPWSVTIWALDDQVPEGLHTGAVTIAVDSSDATFDGLALGPVIATIEDDDLGNSWQNPVNRYDVSGDGKVTTFDLITLLRRLATHGAQALPPPGPGFFPPLFYDVSGDNRLTVTDSILMLRRLNGQPDGAPDSEHSAGSLSSQPLAGTGATAAAVKEEPDARHVRRSPSEAQNVSVWAPADLTQRRIIWTGPRARIWDRALESWLLD